TGYTYDNMDRLQIRTDPLLKNESYVYDAAGNLTLFRDRKLQASTYVYDGLNRRTTATYADSSNTSYTFDKANRLTSITDSIAGQIIRGYDGLDRLTSEQTPQGTVGYTYDSASRRATMTVPGQSTVVYSYDNGNRLTQITQGSSIVQFGYDNANRRTSLTLPNNILVEYGYDAASRVTGITYKQNGTTVIGDLTYEYDKAGNRTKTGGNDAGNRQLTFGDKTLAYDDNGNLQSITDSNGTTLYSWNARNQLVGISGPSLNASFVYDGQGRREKKTINGGLTEFLYDGINPVQESSGAAVLADILPGLGIDEFLTRTDLIAGTTSHLLRDALGSVLALADNAATVQTEYTYEPFGKSTMVGTSSSNPFQYTGREYDGAGLYYYRARYYDPSLQRFSKEDPILQAGDPAVPFLVPVLLQNPPALHPYAYAWNSPIRMKDPLGFSAEDECVRQAWNDMWYRCIIPIVMAADPALLAVVLGCSTLGPGAPACILGYGALVELPVLVGVALCYSEYIKKVALCRCRR
ncbi:MAG: Rhs family protein, partial [Deltaproteobacteria bacterium]|nr:Rhs family protein [Deltaproteobacteria bacterium]